MSVTIIGIDCAVNRKDIGVAIGEYSGGACTILKVADRTQSVVEIVGQHIRESEKTLLALDAPLGWPMLLGKELVDHMAGATIEGDSHSLFRRTTDKFVKNTFGKQPLDVGADRIARTALATLQLLGQIRRETGLDVPLAWTPEYTDRAAAIEVYPAGSLTSHGFTAKGYKDKDQAEVRRQILNKLRRLICLDINPSHAESDPNVLDAIICVLAGRDFLAGEALAPSDASPPVEVHVAEKEGWIWIKRR